MASVEVVPLELKKKDIKKFVKFAWKVYKGNRYWVPPIITDQIDLIIKGPYHEVGVIQPYLAYRDGEIVGRVIAHYDRRHNEYYNEKRGCLGFFECINDQEVANALFEQAERWNREQGMKEIAAPMNFLMYDASGMLLDDYDNIPCIELGYNLPYYVGLFENYGFNKTTDWYAFLSNTDHKFPDLFYRMHKKVKERAEKGEDGFTLRNIDLKHNYERDRDNVQDVFNEAWKGNWGHYPLTDNQIEAFGKDLKLIAKEELVIFAEYNGNPVGFILSVPDANIALKKANGRLFPFGLFKILLGMRKIDRVKTFMMGVLEEYRMKGIDAYFYVESFERARRMGYKYGDMSLIVESNVNMINALKHMGAEIYKTYRFYSKSL